MAFIIYENEQPLDGEIYHSKASLFRALGFADHSAKVFEFDIAEACRDGATAFRVVTEDMVHEAYAAGEIDMERDWHKLPGDYLEQAETAADVAERQLDEVA